jgi:hypothetical protein
MAERLHELGCFTFGVVKSCHHLREYGFAHASMGVML